MSASLLGNKQEVRREPNGPLWAYPVFLLGLSIFCLAIVYGPLPFTGPTGALRRVAQLREQLGDQSPDSMDEWLEAAEKSAALAPRPDIQVKARLLLAEGWLLRVSVLSTEEAARRIRLVQEELLALGEPENTGDRDRKSYLLARSKFMAGEDIPGAIEALKTISESSDLGAEALVLLGKCYLASQPQNVKAALAANDRLRALGTLTDGQRAQAQLSAGELYLAMQQPEEARRVLDKVGGRAPADIRAKAGMMLAQSYQEQGLWSQATEAWMGLLESKTITDPQALAKAWFSLGVCHQKSDQPTQAVEALEKVLEYPAGDSTRQAQLLLGQYTASDPDRARSLAHFLAALDGIKSPAQWRSREVDLARARLVVETTLENWMRGPDFESAKKLAELNLGIAEPSRGTVLVAQVLESQARALLEPESWAKAGGKEKALALSRGLFLQAARANTQVAENLPNDAQQAAHLWLAARQCREAQDHAQAVNLLTRFLLAAPNSEKSGEAWYRMGESLAALKRNADSLAAYKECIKFLTPFSYRARYQIGADAMLKGNLDQAAETLEHNLQVLRLSPDPEAQEMSLYALGSLYFQRRDWKMVMRRLEEALERYPKNPQNLKARLWLADAYRQLALQEHQNSLSGEQITTETRAHFQAEHRRWLERAVVTYTDVRLALELPDASSLLTQDELDSVGLLLADTWFQLGRYGEALALYEEQVGKLAGRNGQLVALGGTIRCNSSLGRYDKLAPAMEQIRLALPRLDEKTRKEWESWINTASRSTRG